MLTFVIALRRGFLVKELIVHRGRACCLVQPVARQTGGCCGEVHLELDIFTFMSGFTAISRPKWLIGNWSYTNQPEFWRILKLRLVRNDAEFNVLMSLMEFAELLLVRLRDVVSVSDTKKSGLQSQGKFGVVVRSRCIFVHPWTVPQKYSKPINPFESLSLHKSLNLSKWWAHSQQQAIHINK